MLEFSFVTIQKNFSSPEVLRWDAGVHVKHEGRFVFHSPDPFNIKRRHRQKDLLIKHFPEHFTWLTENRVSWGISCASSYSVDNPPDKDWDTCTIFLIKKLCFDIWFRSQTKALAFKLTCG